MTLAKNSNDFNFSKMQITIDCRMSGASGVGVYLDGCLPFFLQSGHQFLLLCNPRNKKALPEISAGSEIIECDVKPFSIKELLFFPKSILKKINKTQVYFSPYFNIPHGIKIPVFTTIHDIIFPDMKELTSKIGLAARMFFYKRAFKLSKKIFTVSDFSKSRIEFYSKNKTTVIKTHTSVLPFFLNINSDIKKEKTIIFIGNIKKHKGLNILLDAFLMARNNGLEHKLLIAGTKENFRTKDKELAAKLNQIDENEIEFVQAPSNEKLKELLSKSALLVQPSLYEGFGLPPLEAMLCGTKALISDIAVFKEIYAVFPVVFFKNGDAQDLKTKLMELLFQKEPETIKLSSELKERYTFQKTSNIILSELQK